MVKGGHLGGRSSSRRCGPFRGSDLVLDAAQQLELQLDCTSINTLLVIIFARH
jgi:hypothetical protein